jgi:hypothetical protein
LVELDPQVIDLLRQAADFETWPGFEKLRVVITDGLSYLPDLPVDHLYADIWATPGEAQSIPDMQRIQANVRAKQAGWWGQELLFVDWLAGETPTLEKYTAWAEALGLPLIERDNPAYPAAVEQVSRSYCYRMFKSDPARAGSPHSVLCGFALCRGDAAGPWVESMDNRNATGSIARSGESTGSTTGRCGW